MKKPKRGGVRPGAGRPRQEHGELSVTRSISLYESTWTLLERLCEASCNSQREVIEDALSMLARKRGLE